LRKATMMGCECSGREENSFGATMRFEEAAKVLLCCRAQLVINFERGYVLNSNLKEHANGRLTVSGHRRSSLSAAACPDGFPSANS